MQNIDYINDMPNDMLKSALKIKATELLEADLTQMEPQQFLQVYSELITHLEGASNDGESFNQFLKNTVDLIKDKALEWKARGGNVEGIDILQTRLEVLQEYNDLVDKAGEKMTLPPIQNIDGLYHRVEEYSVGEAVRKNNYVADRLGIQGESLTLIPETVMNKVVFGSAEISSVAMEALTPNEMGKLVPQNELNESRKKLDEEIRRKMERDEALNNTFMPKPMAEADAEAIKLVQQAKAGRLMP